jgi:hypothetical protein
MGAVILFTLLFVVATSVGIVYLVRGAHTAINKDRKQEVLEEQRQEIVRDAMETAYVLTDQYYNGYDHSQIPRLMASLDLQVKEYYRNSKSLDAHRVDTVERKALDN